MAALDDFFAKKDKKKSKPKKFLTPEEIAKGLEKKVDTTSKKTSEPIKKPVLTVEELEQQPPGTVVNQIKLEDEWKDFVEEKKDYTGLKIGQLTINEDDDGSGHGSGQEGEYEEYIDEDGEVKDRRVKEGPWKQVIPAEEVMQIPMEKPTTNKIYISPAFKNAVGPVKLRNKNAPDITNELNFPTLSAGEEKLKKKKNEPQFEEVKHGGRMQRLQDIQQKQEQPVVGNRFKSLLTDDDDS